MNEEKIINYVKLLQEHAKRERFRSVVRIDKNNKFIYRMYNKCDKILNAVNEGAINNESVYCSLNSFIKPRGTTENISQLEHLYIDIDCYRKNYTKEQVIWLLEEDYFNQSIPIPNFIIDSGRGLYLIWNIQPVPIRALPLWSAIERYFHGILEELGSDPQVLEPTRFLRIPGTFNTKSNTIVNIESTYNYTYTLKEIKDEFLNYKSNYKKVKNKNNKVVKNVLKFFNEYTLNRARVEDLKKLCELRKYDLKGHRELILFLYRYWSCLVLQDKEKALEEVIELNTIFEEPLKLNEVKKATKSAEKYYEENRYNYTNKRLIELLCISEDEMKFLQTIISKEEKKRRNNEYNKKKIKEKRRNENGLTCRQQNKVDKLINILELQKLGLKQIEIANRLNITKQSVSKLLKEYRNKELQNNIISVVNKFKNDETYIKIAK